MKKNIGFVPMDSSLAAWLLEKLTLAIGSNYSVGK